jgi:hypothetical protein
LGSAVAIARWTFFENIFPMNVAYTLRSVFADLHRRSSSFFASTTPLRMFILSLLFVLASFLLLALDGVTLSQIIMLVLNHISMFHVVGLFLIVGINLCIIKSLLFPTIQKPDRHLAMTKGYTDAMKLEKFTGVNFKRWQTRAQLWLTAMGIFWVVGNPRALPLRYEKEVQEFTIATTIFVGCILSVLSDLLCDVYMNIKSAAELWEALEHKFGAADTGHEFYVMEKYHDFKMVENRSVVEQAHEFQLTVRELEQLGHALPDKFANASSVEQFSQRQGQFGIS